MLPQALPMFRHYISKPTHRRSRSRLNNTSPIRHHNREPLLLPPRSLARSLIPPCPLIRALLHRRLLVALRRRVRPRRTRCRLARRPTVSPQTLRRLLRRASLFPLFGHRTSTDAWKTKRAADRPKARARAPTMDPACLSRHRHRQQEQLLSLLSLSHQLRQFLRRAPIATPASTRI